MFSTFCFLHSYEFKVKPKNELGVGPLSEPVSFNTESGTPRPLTATMTTMTMTMTTRTRTADQDTNRTV